MTRNNIETNIIVQPKTTMKIEPNVIFKFKDSYGIHWIIKCYKTMTSDKIRNMDFMKLIGILFLLMKIKIKIFFM